jgi:hypothetical protein
VVNEELRKEGIKFIKEMEWLKTQNMFDFFALTY